MPKRTSKKQGNPQMRALIVSAILTVLLIVSLAAIGAILIIKGILPANAAPILAAVAVFLATLLGPMPLIKAMGKKPLPVAYVMMAALLVLMLLFKWVCWPTAAYGNWPVLAAAPIGATLSGIAMSRKPKHKH